MGCVGWDQKVLFIPHITVLQVNNNNNNKKAPNEQKCIETVDWPAGSIFSIICDTETS